MKAICDAHDVAPSNIAAGRQAPIEDRQGAPTASDILRFSRRGRRHKQPLGTKAAAQRDPARDEIAAALCGLRKPRPTCEPQPTTHASEPQNPFEAILATLA